MNKIISVFGRKELGAIAGMPGGRNVLVLFVISFLALLSLGLAFSIQSFLSREMEGTFVRFVSVNWPYECADSDVDQVSAFRSEVQSKFGVEVNGLYTANCRFVTSVDTVASVVGLVSDTTDVLFELLYDDDTEILVGPNIFSLLKEAKGSQIDRVLSSKEGVVVSQGFLKSSQLPIETKEIAIFIEGGYTPLYLPICAVYRNLPAELDVIMHAELLQGVNSIRGKHTQPAYWDSVLTTIESTTCLVPEQVLRSNRGFFRVQEKRPSPGYGGGYVVQLEDDVRLPMELAEFMWVSPGLALELSKGSVTSSIRPIMQDLNKSPDYMGVLFDADSLDRVRAFADFVQKDREFAESVCAGENPSLKVDLGKIKSKESITLLSRIALFLGLTLMIAASMLLILRCNAIFQLHIEKNRASLGTLKAFGLSNSHIIGLYSSIAVLMLVMAFILAQGLLVFAGPAALDGVKILLGLSNELSGELVYSNIPFLFGFIAFVIVPVIFIASKIRSLLQRSPGTLVFGRKTS